MTAPRPADAAREVMTADELRAMAENDESIANDRYEGELLFCNEQEAADLLSRASRLRALAAVLEEVRLRDVQVLAEWADAMLNDRQLDERLRDVAPQLANSRLVRGSALSRAAAVFSALCPPAVDAPADRGPGG